MEGDGRAQSRFTRKGRDTDNGGSVSCDVINKLEHKRGLGSWGTKTSANCGEGKRVPREGQVKIASDTMESSTDPRRAPFTGGGGGGGGGGGESEVNVQREQFCFAGTTGRSIKVTWTGGEY